MDTATAQRLHREFSQLVQDFGKRNNLNIRSGTFRYDGTGFKVSVEGKETTTTSAGSAITATALQMAARHGLDPNKSNARGWKIVDYHASAHKYPWIVQDLAGQRRKITSELARTTFTRTTPTTTSSAPPRPTPTPAPSTPARSYDPQF